jgi:hypothetical protein
MNYFLNFIFTLSLKEIGASKSLTFGVKTKGGEH